MMKLLISGLGGSLFPYMHEKLKDNFELYYIDADEQLKYLYKDLNLYVSPFIIEPNYWDFVRNIVIEQKIDFYIPLIDEEITQSKVEIEKNCGVPVVTPTAAFSSLCLNKYQLMQRLNELKISQIESYTADQFNWELDLPIFIKPIYGRGSRGIMKIEHKEQLDAYYLLENYNKEDIIIQPLLEGVEYTVGVLASNTNELISISSKRIIKKKGITILAVTENNELIELITKKIIKELKPCGPFNIQLMLTPENEVKIFEINPRFSTTTIMEIEGGLNPILNFINYYNKDFKNEVLRPRENLTLHRRWENLFYEH